MSTLMSLVIFVALVLHALIGYGESKDCFIKSIYSFGDSIADTGNLLHEGTAGFFAPIASFPYGETYKKATGRCSDGLLMIDYFAMNLNISLINPYLDKSANFDNGVNFAVAGATALDNSFFSDKGVYLSPNNTPLSVQLQWFKAHLNSKCSSNEDCRKIFEQTLFLMGEIGGNDYNNAFFQGKTIEEVKNYVPRVVEGIINATKVVINEGAVQLVVPGNFPIGCSPSYLTMFYTTNSEVYDQRNCLKRFNSFANYHNEQLQNALEGLRNEYPQVTIMYADYYQAFLYLLDNAENLGFDKDSLLKACCGAGGQYNFNLSVTCGMTGTKTCIEPRNYISWDGIHLTQEAYKIMAKSVIMEGFGYANKKLIQDQWKC